MMGFHTVCSTCGAPAVGRGQGMRDACPNGCDTREEKRLAEERKKHSRAAQFCCSKPEGCGDFYYTTIDTRMPPNVGPCRRCSGELELVRTEGDTPVREDG